MARYESVSLMACWDCTAMVANGELGNGDPTDDAAHAARMVEYAAGHYSLAQVVNGNEENGTAFSSAPCELCGNHLAGAREECVLLLPTGSESHA